MSNFTPTYVRRLSSFKKEAASAIRGHWPAALGISLVLTLLMLLPGAAFLFMLTYTPMPLTANDAEALMSVLNQSSSAITLNLVLSLLLVPIVWVAQSYLGLNLLRGEPISLRRVWPSLREWARSLRVALLGYIYSLWPFLLGMIALMIISTISAVAAGESVSLSGALPNLTMIMIIPVYALMIYSVTRLISYLPAQHLLVLCPQDNARRLLRRSRTLTKGHKGRLFLLYLSFIGWLYLSVLVPALLGSLVTGFLPADAVTLINTVFPMNLCLLLLVLLSSLPLSVYVNTSAAAFTLHFFRRDSTASEPIPEEKAE